MNLIQKKETGCPYCGELIDIIIDCSESNQEYIEDCEICCKPMVIKLAIDISGNIDLNCNSLDEC